MCRTNGGSQSGTLVGQSNGVMNGLAPRPIAPRGRATRRGSRSTNMSGTRERDATANETMTAPRGKNNRCNSSLEAGSADGLQDTPGQPRKKSRKSAPVSEENVGRSPQNTMETMQPGPTPPRAPLPQSALGYKGFDIPGMQQSGFEYHYSPNLALKRYRTSFIFTTTA